MVQFTYTPQAWAALAKNPEDRADAFRALAEQMGAKLLSLHYCFGEYDGVTMMEAPDEATVMAILLAANSPGHVKTTRTTVLITLREAMVAMRRAHDAQYRGPHGD
ncbi:MAG TPA: GYD domain-containing protein [bacterium]|nr:GYD domain-containing protein [bacterium]